MTLAFQDPLKQATSQLQQIVAEATPRPLPGFLLKPTTLTVPELLRAAATTFEERNAVYGSNYKMVGPMVKILFPDGVPAHVIHSDRWHLFELILVKLSRFAISDLNHVDSIHDTTVYAAMIESLLQGDAS